MSSSNHPGAPRVRAASRPPSELLQRVKRGEISLDEYLDVRAEKALDHVRGKVGPEILETVRATIREQLRTDPVLVELVRRASGQVPTPPAETVD